MKNIFKNFFRFVMELLFPSNLKCIFCGKDVPNPEFCCCNECLDKLKFNLDNNCVVCGDLLVGDEKVCENCKSYHKNFNRAVSPLFYDTLTRKVVLKFKDGDGRYLAPHIAKFMFNKLQEAEIDFDIIIPIPLSAKSLERRKFNQADLLAQELSRLSGKPVKNDVLIKVKETKHQKELGFYDRQKNLAGAFKINDKASILNKNILLVDDVMTTCATANECSKVLKKFANNIFVLTFARNTGNKLYKK